MDYLFHGIRDNLATMSYWYLILAFLSGSIPFAVIISKLKGTDIRKAGSGNPGATNVARTLGFKYGIVVLLLDMAKAAIPAFMASKTTIYYGWIAGSLAVLGHIFSPFLKFKGGKGVASLLGVLIAVDFPLALIFIMFFLISFMGLRYVSMSSITGAIAVAMACWVKYPVEIAIVVSSLVLIVILRHSSNIKRIIKGEEPEFKLPSKGNSGKN